MSIDRRLTSGRPRPSERARGGIGAVLGRVALGVIAALGAVVVPGHSLTALELNAAAFDLPVGSIRLSVDRGTTAHCFAFSPDGTRLVAGDTQGGVRVWQWKTERSVKVLKDHKRAVHAVAFDPTGTRFCSADLDGKVYVYEFPGFRRLGPLVGHEGTVVSLAFSPDGRTLVSAGGNRDASVRLWDLATLRPLRSFTIDDPIFGFELAMLNAAGQVVAVEARGKIDLLDRDGLTLIRQKPCGSTNVVASAVGSGTKTFVTADRGGLVSVWDLGSLEPAAEVRPGPRLITRLAVSAAASTLALGFEGETVTDQGVVLIFGVQSRRTQQHKLGTSLVHQVAFAPDGRTLAASLDNGSIFLLPVDLDP